MKCFTLPASKCVQNLALLCRFMFNFSCFHEWRGIWTEAHYALVKDTETVSFLQGSWRRWNSEHGNVRTWSMHINLQWGIRSWGATCCPWEIDIWLTLLSTVYDACDYLGFCLCWFTLLFGGFSPVHTFYFWCFKVIFSPPPPETAFRRKTHHVHVSWLFIHLYVSSADSAFCIGTNDRSLPEINQYGRPGSAVTLGEL